MIFLATVRNSTWNKTVSSVCVIPSSKMCSSTTSVIAGRIKPKPRRCFLTNFEKNSLALSMFLTKMREDEISLLHSSSNKSSSSSNAIVFFAICIFIFMWDNDAAEGRASARPLQAAGYMFLLLFASIELMAFLKSILNSSGFSSIGKCPVPSI